MKLAPFLTLVLALISVGLSSHAQPSASAAASVAPPRDELGPLPFAQEAGVVHRFAVADGVTVLLDVPSTWDGGATTMVSAADQVAQVDGATMVVSHQWQPKKDVFAKHGAHAIRQAFLACAAGPSSAWAPGMTSLALERLSDLAKDELGRRMKYHSFSVGPLQDGVPISQSFRASGRPGSSAGPGEVRVADSTVFGEELSAVGVHSLAFSTSGESRVVLCSVACFEPTPFRTRCHALVNSMHFEGAVGPEPTGSVAARLRAGIGKKPWILVGLALSLLSAGVALMMIIRGMLARFGAREELSG